MYSFVLFLLCSDGVVFGFGHVSQPYAHTSVAVRTSRRAAELSTTLVLDRGCVVDGMWRLSW